MEPIPVSSDPTVGIVALVLALLLFVGGGAALFVTMSRGLSRLDGGKRPGEEGKGEGPGGKPG